MAEITIATEFAELAVTDTGGPGPALLMIHGNSASRRIFERQFADAILAGRRLVAFDLPGHGASSNAREPARAYTISGYAQAAVQVLQALKIERAAVFGWSLGGHVALDMTHRFPGLAGVMISGTPPIPGDPAGAALGFQQTPAMGLTAKPDWTAAEARAFVLAGLGDEAAITPWMLADAERTDGTARQTMFTDAVNGGVADQKAIAESWPRPLAIVNGADDALIRADYFPTLRYANLWDGRVHSLAGLGHTPFWQAPARFNPLLARFAAEVL